MSGLIEAVVELTAPAPPPPGPGFVDFLLLFPARRAGDSNDPTSFCTLVTDKID